MPVETTAPRKEYSGNGTTTNFPFPYYFLADGDLVVTEVTIATGTAAVLTLNTDYTVTGAGNPAGGAVVATTAPASTVQWIIVRDPAITQSVDPVNGDPLDVDVELEQPLDRATMIAQRTREMVERAIRIPDGDTGFSADDMILPAKVTRAGTYLAFTAAGTPTAASGTGNDADLRADMAEFAFGSTNAFHLLSWPISPAENAAAITPTNPEYPWGWVERHGAEDGNPSANVTAFNNCLAAAVAGDQIVSFPPWDFEVDEKISVAITAGDNKRVFFQSRGGKILCGFDGVDDVCLAVEADASASARCESPYFDEIEIDYADSVTDGDAPTLLSLRRVNNVDGAIKLMGYKGSTLCRMSSMWNGMWRRIRGWGGGYSLTSLDVSGVTFAISAGGTSLVASGAVFTGTEQEGHAILLVEGDNVELFSLDTYVNSTHFTVSRMNGDAGGAQNTFTTATGHMDGPKATIAGGSLDTVDVDHAVLGTDVVGRVVWIRGAGHGGAGTYEQVWTHRATVTARPSTSQITIDPAADQAVTKAEIYFSPAFEQYEEGGDAINHFHTINPHFEQCEGLVWAMDSLSARERVISAKIHSIGTGALDTDYFTQCPILLSRSPIHFAGGLVLEGTPISTGGKLSISTVKGCVTIDRLDCTLAESQIAVEMTDEQSEQTCQIGFVGTINDYVSKDTIRGAFKETDPTQSRFSIANILGYDLNRQGIQHPSLVPPQRLVTFSIANTESQVIYRNGSMAGVLWLIDQVTGNAWGMTYWTDESTDGTVAAFLDTPTLFETQAYAGTAAAVTGGKLGVYFKTGFLLEVTNKTGSGVTLTVAIPAG